jgi:hypothetical protein
MGITDQLIDCILMGIMALILPLYLSPAILNSQLTEHVPLTEPPRPGARLTQVLPDVGMSRLGSLLHLANIPHGTT